MLQLLPFDLPADLGVVLARLVLVPMLLAAAGVAAAEGPDPAYARAAEQAKQALVAKHGAAEQDRIDRGVGQVLRYWRPQDGDPAAFSAFVQAEFLPRGEALDRAFDRFEFALERVNGYLTSLGRDLRQGTDLDLGPLLPLDERLAAWNVGAHVSDDLFANRIAFVALLNFPLTTLDQRMREGLGWSRRQWAETRLAGRFQTRVPAEVSAGLTAAYSAAELYVSGYNVYMHHVLSEDGRRLFPAGMRLLSHWNLRDELKARYADPEGARHPSPPKRRPVPWRASSRGAGCRRRPPGSPGGRSSP